MNEVWSAIVYIIIVTIVTEALSIVYIMAQLWKILDRPNVMSLKSLMTSTKLAGKIIPFKNSLPPSAVVRAFAALGVPIITAHRDVLAFGTAISMFNDLGICSPELFAASFTGAKCRVCKATTAPRTIGAAPNVRWRPLNLFAAIFTHDNHFLESSLGRAFTRTIFLLSVFIPVTVCLLGNSFATNLTPFHAFWMRRTLCARNANMSTRVRAIFPRLINLDSFSFVEGYGFPTDLTASCFHGYNYSKVVDKCQV